MKINGMIRMKYNRWNLFWYHSSLYLSIRIITKFVLVSFLFVFIYFWGIDGMSIPFHSCQIVIFFELIEYDIVHHSIPKINNRVTTIIFISLSISGQHIDFFVKNWFSMIVEIDYCSRLRKVCSGCFMCWQF